MKTFQFKQNISDFSELSQGTLSTNVLSDAEVKSARLTTPQNDEVEEVSTLAVFHFRI